MQYWKGFWDLNFEEMNFKKKINLYVKYCLKSSTFAKNTSPSRRTSAFFWTIKRSSLY
jgi:hypothetical protein